MVFGDESAYTEETRNNLKNVMLLEEQEDFDIPIYGKTGMGKLEGIVVDAWHTGFAEKAEGNIYFCIYLGRTDEKDVSSIFKKEPYRADGCERHFSVYQLCFSM